MQNEFAHYPTGENDGYLTRVLKAGTLAISGCLSLGLAAYVSGYPNIALLSIPTCYIGIREILRLAREHGEKVD